MDEVYLFHSQAKLERQLQVRFTLVIFVIFVLAWSWGDSDGGRRLEHREKRHLPFLLVLISDVGLCCLFDEVLFWLPVNFVGDDVAISQLSRGKNLCLESTRHALFETE